MDLNQYIEPRQQTFLHHAEYRMLELVQVASGKMIVHDDVSAEFIDPKHIRLILTRKLRFDPAGVFEAEAAFGTILTLKENSYYLVDWKTYDLAEEIANNSKNLLNPLGARISMLLAEMTSACGQLPVVTPPYAVQPPKKQA